MKFKKFFKNIVNFFGFSKTAYKLHLENKNLVKPLNPMISKQNISTTLKRMVSTLEILYVNIVIKKGDYLPYI